MVIEGNIADFVFVLINTKPEQVHTLNGLINILVISENNRNKSVVLSGEFNIISIPSLDLEGGKRVIKKKTRAKLTQITANLDLWRIRIPKRKQFTFRQQLSTGFIQKRLNYFFSYLFLPENLIKPQIL